MSVETVLFYLFAAITVAGALGVVGARNPVYSVLLLVLTFFATAVLWLLLQAEFLAIVLVLVYVGAVMVLFLFVVMMLDLDAKALRAGFMRYLPLGVAVAALLATQIIMVVGPSRFGLDAFPRPGAAPAEHSNTTELGISLFTEHVYPFELAAMILLVAIVAAIALTLRQRTDTRHQDPARQVKVKRGDRVRLVSMPSEKRQGADQ